jgi:poly(3-hydroxybutyrate) depolymerase
MGTPFPLRPDLGSPHETTTALTEHTVAVAGKPIFVAETGTGPAVVMLHGGGPGASGVSNFSRPADEHDVATLTPDPVRPMARWPTPSV